MYKEKVTITKVKGNNVEYSGGKFTQGCHISNFPTKPNVGQIWEITKKNITEHVSAVLVK